MTRIVSSVVSRTIAPVLMVVIAAVVTMVPALHAQRLPDGMPGMKNLPKPGEPYTKVYEHIPPDVVWKAVVAAYRQAGIKPTTEDVANYRMAYVATPAGKKIGGTKVENVFDCGGDKNAPLAASTELMVSVGTVVKPVGDGSEATTTVIATPTAPANAGEPVVCQSRGALEKKLGPEIKVAFRVR